MDLHEHKHLLFILFSFRLYRNIYNKYIEPETNEGKKKKEEELYKQYLKKIKNTSWKCPKCRSYSRRPDRPVVIHVKVSAGNNEPLGKKTAREYDRNHQQEPNKVYSFQRQQEQTDDYLKFLFEKRQNIFRK